MPQEICCVIGLGANLGDRLSTLESSVVALSKVGSVGGISNLYETAPVGGPAQPDYFNAAVLLRCALSPRPILESILRIEAEHGRVRATRWGPRLLDLDLLWIDGVVVDEPGLQVPHPRLTERSFALLPLLDVAPDAKDPSTRCPYAEMRKYHGVQAIRLHGIARRTPGDWLEDQVPVGLWQIADLPT